MARDSLDISDDKDDGKKQKETESGDNTNHLDEYRLNRYIISKDPYAFDASGWTLDQIKEHQRLMEMNRDEAEKSYELACTQLNTLIAVSGIALSIVVSCMFAFNDSNSSVIVASCCFIASSLIISAYSSLRSRRVLASYPTGWMPQIMSKSFSRRKSVFTAGFPKYVIKRSLSDRVVRERDSEANAASFSKDASQRQFL